MIDATTRLVGLIGWPVTHSLSPVMHNAAFDALRMNWRYLPLPAARGSVAAAVRGLAALGFAGANVTVPHKSAVLESVDSLSDEARSIGAVNTLVVQRGEDGGCEVRGHNTDVAGFGRSLETAGVAVAGERVVVVGAGGSARAIVRALLDAGAADIAVLARRLDQAACIADRSKDGEASRVRPIRLGPDSLIEATRSAALLVHATPVGMAPDVGSSIWPDDVPVPADLTVVDLVYGPRETRLLAQVRAAGGLALDGLDMLIAQGAESFRLWTDRDPPIDAMRRACKLQLQRTSQGGVR